MDSLYQEMLEKEITKKEVDISLNDDEIVSVLMRCHARQSCEGCPYDELHTPRCRDILLNELIGLVNRLKKAKEDVAREIFEEIKKLICRRMIPDMALIDDRLITDIAELKKKVEEGNEFRH